MTIQSGVKPKGWLKLKLIEGGIVQCWTVPPCPFPHGRPAFGPSCTEFVYPGCLHFDNGATSKIDEVFLGHNGLLHVIPLTVHLNSYFMNLFFKTPPSCLKVIGGVGRAHDFVSASVPLGLIGSLN